MKSIERKHVCDIAKGLAYYVLAKLSELEDRDGLETDPDYLTDVVFSRLNNINFNNQIIREWLSSESLRKSVISIFTENLKR